MSSCSTAMVPCGGVALLVEELLDDQLLAERVPASTAQPEPWMPSRGGGEVRLELVERAEELVDRGGELALGLVAAVRATGWSRRSSG